MKKHYADGVLTDAEACSVIETFEVAPGVFVRTSDLVAAGYKAIWKSAYVRAVDRINVSVTYQPGLKGGCTFTAKWSIKGRPAGVAFAATGDRNFMEKRMLTFRSWSMSQPLPEMEVLSIRQMNDRAYGRIRDFVHSRRPIPRVEDADVDNVIRDVEFGANPPSIDTDALLDRIIGEWAA